VSYLRYPGALPVEQGRGDRGKVRGRDGRQVQDQVQGQVQETVAVGSDRERPATGTDD
jgi:hypothetical protein